MRPAFWWMNDISRQFLGKDYLLNGQRGEARVAVIADQFGKRLKRPDLGDKLYDYVGRGWISFSSPVWSNYGLTRGLPISCVTGDTWINTRHGGGKQARDIVVGDEVLTHKGRYRRVTKVIPTKDRSDIYRLKVVGRMTPLRLTGDHLVLTNLGWMRTDALDPDKHLVAINREVELPEIDYTIDLRPFCQHEVVEQDGRLLKAGSKNVRTDRQVSHVSYCAKPIADVRVTEDLAWALGVWFAEGSISVNTSTNTPSGIRVTLHVEEQDVANRWLAVMTQALGVNGRTFETSVTRGGRNNGWLTVNVNSSVVGNLFESFGRGCKEKVMPDWVIDLPKPLLAHVLTGLLDGDGSRRKNGAVKLTLANPRLVLQAYQIALKLGHVVSLQMQEKAGALATTTYVYTLLFLVGSLSSNRHRSSSVVAFHDGLSYAPIRDITHTEEVADVFDFTVDEDHSFSAAGVVLHNCFGTYVQDDIRSILRAHVEVGMMSKHGGGTSLWLNPVRPRGSDITDNGKSAGSVHFAGMFEKEILTINQGSTRRGECAVYWDIDHPDVPEALQIRVPENGLNIHKLSYGVVIRDEWMKAMIAGDKAKRERWAAVIQSRMTTGYPYLIFIDNARKQQPAEYNKFDLSINHSNLCTEIFLSDGPDESFVCCLSSMNMLCFDEWKDTDAVEVAVYFLDTVMEEFIEKARNEYGYDRAVRFAERQRALGLGQLGWHSYLQSRMIPFDSLPANSLAASTSRTIRDLAFAASRKMAAEYGKPYYLEGSDRRHMTLTAIAPNQSSSAILGQVSESTDPMIANFSIKDKQKIKYTHKNPALMALLAGKGKDTTEVVQSIFNNQGSVQHLEFLTPGEKAVFKTHREISPMAQIQQAAARAPYVCQGQSLNLLIDPAADLRQVNKLLISAWEMGLKSLYYQKNISAAQELTQDLLSCTACEG